MHFNVLGLSVVDIYWRVGFHHHLYLQLTCNCSSSGPDFHLYQRIPVAFVVVHVVY